MSEQGLRFRPYEPDDRIPFVRLVTDRAAMAHMDGALSAEKAGELFQRILTGHPRIACARAVLQEETYVGHGFLTRADEEPDSLEIGFMVVPAAWGQGLGTAIARHMVSLAEDRADCRRLIGTVDDDHTASIRVLEKSGFRLREQRTDEVGTFRVYERPR